MDTLKKYFPLSFRGQDTASLVISIIIYVVIDIITGAVVSLFTWIPLLGILIGLVGSLIGVYTFAGIIIALLAFFNVLK